MLSVFKVDVNGPPGDQVGLSYCKSSF